MVALHWGGERAFVDSVIALSFLLALALRDGLASSSWMPATLRLRFVWLGFGMLMGACVAIFSGGAYMGDRFLEASDDLQGRMRHWQASTGMLHGGAAWWFGKTAHVAKSHFVRVPDPNVLECIECKPLPVELVVRAVQGLPKGSFRNVRNAFHELVDEDVQVIFGPWVSENAVALVKSAVAAANNAYESAHKAAKQATGKSNPAIGHLPSPSDPAWRKLQQHVS